jgi:hypothetical protein
LALARWLIKIRTSIKSGNPTFGKALLYDQVETTTPIDFGYSRARQLSPLGFQFRAFISIAGEFNKIKKSWLHKIHLMGLKFEGTQIGQLPSSKAHRCTSNACSITYVWFEIPHRDSSRNQASGAVFY